MILVTGTGNRLFLPVLQAFMHRETAEHLPQLCSFNPNIPVPMQFIPIYFSHDSCCFLLIPCCVVCIFLGTVPKAECQAAIWPSPKWTEQDLSKALFPVTHSPRCLLFCPGTMSQALLTVHIDPTLCRASAELVTLHHTTEELLISTWTTYLTLNSTLTLILFPSLELDLVDSGLEPQQCHSTGWNTPFSSPKPSPKPENSNYWASSFLSW